MPDVRFHRFASSSLKPTRQPTRSSGNKQAEPLINSTSNQARTGNDGLDDPETPAYKSIYADATRPDEAQDAAPRRKVYHDAFQVVQELQPEHPVTLIHRKAATDAAQQFKTLFPGRTMYAVKANDSPALLRLLHANGITWFDVASINEVKQVRSALRALSPQPTMCFMNPVKSPEAIREAYHSYGIRVFSLDDEEELEKIVQATSTGSERAQDLTLCVRIRVPSRHAKIDLETKYGLLRPEVVRLLQMARDATKNTDKGARLGICFHVGSQAMATQDFRDAFHEVSALVREASITIDIVDVCGGFPVKYPDMNPPPLSEFLQVIGDSRRALQETLGLSIELWAEPGRLLSARYESLLVRVMKRRGLSLYLNAGPFNSLFDAGFLKWRFSVKLVRNPPSSQPNLPFKCYGPTCDNDLMRGPFDLPSDIQTGDYFEIIDVGAYSSALRTRYNGFYTSESVVMADE